MMHGVRTIKYNVNDLAEAKIWYSAVFDQKPYYDKPFYVGFEIEGFELGLVPADETEPAGPGGVVAYWGVDDINAALARLQQLGGRLDVAIIDVDDDIKVATVLDPSGNVFGIIENPHFKGGK